MSDEAPQPYRDPFYDIKPKRAWLRMSNICDKGKFRVVLEVNGQDKELLHVYASQDDGVVSNEYNLTWLIAAETARADAAERLAERYRVALEEHRTTWHSDSTGCLAECTRICQALASADGVQHTYDTPTTPAKVRVSDASLAARYRDALGHCDLFASDPDPQEALRLIRRTVEQTLAADTYSSPNEAGMGSDKSPDGGQNIAINERGNIVAADPSKPVAGYGDRWKSDGRQNVPHEQRDNSGAGNVTLTNAQLAHIATFNGNSGKGER